MGRGAWGVEHGVSGMGCGTLGRGTPDLTLLHPMAAVAGLHTQLYIAAPLVMAVTMTTAAEAGCSGV